MKLTASANGEVAGEATMLYNPTPGAGMAAVVSSTDPVQIGSLNVTPPIVGSGSTDTTKGKPA